ncbi:MAG TPA: organomercurial lyase [Candidatus Tectomicrobia bacterium]|nr:organomercurial lyase [Candidatus Tectomicrobia bacterium]
MDVTPSTRRVRALIVESFVETGRAPTVCDLAERLALSRPEVLAAFRELATIDTFAVEAGTDNIRLLSPFSNLPTAYRVSVDGRPGWFAVCGPESLAMSLMFPGRRIDVDAYCRDCCARIRLAMQDHRVLEQDGPLVVHLGVPVARWLADLPFA